MTRRNCNESYDNRCISQKGSSKIWFFVKNKIYGIDCGISWVYISNFNPIGQTVFPLGEFEVWGQRYIQPA